MSVASLYKGCQVSDCARVICWSGLFVYSQVVQGLPTGEVPGFRVTCVLSAILQQMLAVSFSMFREQGEGQKQFGLISNIELTIMIISMNASSQVSRIF